MRALILACALAASAANAGPDARDKIAAIEQLFGNPTTPICGRIFYPKDHPRVSVRFYFSRSRIAVGDTLSGMVLFDTSARGRPNAELPFRDVEDWRTGTPLPIPSSERTDREQQFADDLAQVLSVLSDEKDQLPATLPACP